MFSCRRGLHDHKASIAISSRTSTTYLKITEWSASLLEWEDLVDEHSEAKPETKCVIIYMVWTLTPSISAWTATLPSLPVPAWHQGKPKLVWVSNLSQSDHVLRVKTSSSHKPHRSLAVWTGDWRGDPKWYNNKLKDALVFFSPSWQYIERVLRRPWWSAAGVET